MAIISNAIRNAIQDAVQGDYTTLISLPWTVHGLGHLQASATCMDVWLKYDDNAKQFVAKINDYGSQRGLGDDELDELPEEMKIPGWVIDAITDKISERVALVKERQSNGTSTLTYKDWYGYSYRFTATGEHQLKYLLDEIAEWVADSIQYEVVSYILQHMPDDIRCDDLKGSIEHIDIEAPENSETTYTAIVTLNDGARWICGVNVHHDDDECEHFAIFEAEVISAVKEEKHG